MPRTLTRPLVASVAAVTRKESAAGGVEPGMTPAPAVDPPVTELPPPADPDAFIRLAREHDRALRSLVFRLVGDRDAMDDVLQETYLRAYRSRQSFRGEASIGTWLYRIAYNTSMDELRRRGRHQTVELDETLDTPSTSLGPDDLAALRGDLATALDRLPHEMRAAVLLVDAEGLDYAAAGQVLGVAAGTVGSRVSRGRAALRLSLTTGDHR
jgi:RNA polymerase sigma-70 factor (ECF subfamily)